MKHEDDIGWMVWWLRGIVWVAILALPTVLAFWLGRAVERADLPSNAVVPTPMHVPFEDHRPAPQTFSQSVTFGETSGMITFEGGTEPGEAFRTAQVFYVTPEKTTKSIATRSVVPHFAMDSDRSEIVVQAEAPMNVTIACRVTGGPYLSIEQANLTGPGIDGFLARIFDDEMWEDCKVLVADDSDPELRPVRLEVR